MSDNDTTVESIPLLVRAHENKPPSSFTFDKIKRALEVAGSAAISAAGLEVMLNTSAAASPLLTTAATHVLGNIFPLVAIGAEVVIFVEAFRKVLKRLPPTMLISGAVFVS